MSRIFQLNSVSLDPTALRSNDAAAHLVVDGLEQGGPSFEVRVFLGNPSADEATPRDVSNGYAGSIHVYGLGSASDAPRAAAKSPMRRTLPIPKELRAALPKDASVPVTLVYVASRAQPLAADAIPPPSAVSIEVRGTGRDA